MKKKRFTVFPLNSCRLHRRRPRGLACIILPAFLLAACTSTLKPVVYPGKVVRTRVASIEERPSLTAHLAPSKDDRVCIQLMDLRLRTLREVPIHEKVIQYIDESSEDRRPVRQEIVPGVFIEGAPRIRNEHTVVGPLAETSFLINGSPAQTNANGVYEDDAGQILALFDPPKVKEATVTIEVKGRGTALLRFSRTQLLDALGVDTRIGPAGRNDRLRFQVECPKTVAAGGGFEMTVTVMNRDKTAAWAVEARSFSRHSWMDGRNFYFGRLGPGARRVFHRRFRVPRDAAPGLYYAAVGFWDWLGPARGKSVPLAITVTRTPAAGDAE